MLNGIRHQKCISNMYQIHDTIDAKNFYHILYTYMHICMYASYYQCILILDNVNESQYFVISILFLIIIHFVALLFLSLSPLALFTWPKFSDRLRVQSTYEKLSRLYNRLIKSHENIDNVLESIRIWGHVPLYQRRESNSASLLDIDDRSMKFKTRCIEVNNSKKLIEYAMEENYRLLFDLPLFERKKEFGKDRLRNTIMRKFGRHQAKDKFERSPSVVS